MLKLNVNISAAYEGDDQCLAWLDNKQVYDEFLDDMRMAISEIVSDALQGEIQPCDLDIDIF